jgi:penicillin-binding protein 1A
LSTSRSRPIALIALFALFSAACAQLQDLPRLSDEDLDVTLAQSTRLFDVNGRVVTSLHGPEDRTVISSIERIPDHVRDAVVAIEDERFYEHDGVDMRAIVRAAMSNVSRGQILEGGSTITQQYVKNVIIAPGQTAERTLERKINEAALARQVEERLTKDEILLRYLNTIYFGNGAYGIQAAARRYFGRHVGRLSLAQAATLAGLIRSPEAYNPHHDPEAALARRNRVLDKMAALGWADPEHVERAQARPIKLSAAAIEERYPAPYFVDYVQRLLTFDPRFEMLGKTVKQRTQSIFKGGLRIFTTVDLDEQTAAEEAVNQVLTEESDPHGSLVSLDPNTGHIRAMVGGRDWFASPRQSATAKVNLAIAAEPGLGARRVGGTAAGTGRQGGSAYKTFALAAAIQEGVPLSKQYRAQACMSFPGADNGRDWRPCNYESTDFGRRVSLLEATAKSINVVYAQLILEIGPEKVVELARQMGIATDPQLPVPSAVLGSNPVNPLGMASAYGVLATNGVRHAPVAVTKIETATGQVIYEDETKGERVLEPAVAYLTTTALRSVVQNGTGVRANIGGAVAGKTGTSQEWRDAWFVGYTPERVTAVSVFYPEGEIEMKTSCSGASPCRPTRITVTGGSWPAEIWGTFMSRALAGVPRGDFPVPDIGLVTVTIDSRTGCLAGRLTPEEFRTEASFPKGAEPEETCPRPRDGEKVPDVVGFPAREATNILEDAGFEVEVTEEHSSSYPPGYVIDQRPRGERRALEGSVVTLFVSAPGSGSDDRIVVPDVLGKKADEARRMLHDAGFNVRLVYQRESNRERARRNRDRVWKQNPAGGTRAKRGSQVTIWVNP